MRSTTAERYGQIERLRADYKGAFDEWALQVDRLHEIIGSAPGSFVISEAEERVAAAETTYRNTRDRLTDNMSTKPNTCS